MILYYFNLIEFVATSNDLNLVNENLLNVLQENHQLISLLVEEAMGIEANNGNQILESQNKTHLNQAITQRVNTEFYPIGVRTNTQYNDFLTNHYSSAASAYQALNYECNQNLDGIYNMYINDAYGRLANDLYLSQLNDVYEKYLIDAYIQYVTVIVNIQNTLSSTLLFDNNLNISYLHYEIQQCNILINDIFMNSAEWQHLNDVYLRYSNLFFINQHAHLIDNQNPDEYTNHIFNYFSMMFINDLTSRTIYEMINQQFINDNTIECCSTYYRQYFQHPGCHETPVDNGEYIDSIYVNYIRYLYPLFLDDFNARYLCAVQEALDSVIDPYQAELYRIYIRSINNLGFSPYIYRHLNTIYYHCMNDDTNEPNLNTTNN